MGRKHPSHQLPQPLGSLTDSPKADRYRVRKLEAFSLPIVGDYGKPEAMSRTSSDKNACRNFASEASANRKLPRQQSWWRQSSAPY